jgi:hypothetical protein
MRSSSRQFEASSAHQQRHSQVANLLEAVQMRRSGGKSADWAVDVHAMRSFGVATRCVSIFCRLFLSFSHLFTSRGVCLQTFGIKKVYICMGWAKVEYNYCYKRPKFQVPSSKFQVPVPFQK